MVELSAIEPALAGVQRISREPLRVQVQAQIRQLILTNGLHPGQPIVIDQLVREFGVSHTPIREALAMLQHDGLVQLRPYGHPKVAEIEPSDIREVWQMRMLLEGWAVKKATPILQDAELDQMEGALQHAGQDAELGRYESHLASDVALHEMILRSTHNSLFDRLSQLVSDQSTRIRSLVESIASPDKVLAIIAEHLALLAAIRARSPELAYERLIAHLEAGMVRTLGALEEIRVSDERIR